jgi:hypothetical protein
LLEFLDQVGINLWPLVIAILASAIIFFVGYRRFIFSIFDPLCMFVLILVGDSALTFALPWSPSLKWEFVGFLAFFWAGFSLRGRLTQKTFAISFGRQHWFELELMLLILCAVILGANLYLGLSTGFPLLSLHPSESKVTIYTGGLGVIRRVNMGPYLFFCSGCMLLIMAGHKTRFALTIFCLTTGLEALNGSKGVMLPGIYAAGFMLAHRGLVRSRTFKAKAKRYIFAFLAIGVTVAVIVTTRDQSSVSEGLSKFFLRFLLAGDVILYYIPNRDTLLALMGAHSWSYLHYLLGDILGMLRISDYQPALGSVILGSDEGFGPNPQFFIQADLFFGPVVGLLYSLILGYAVSSLRRAFFGKPGKSAVWFAFKLMLALTAFDLAIDSSEFVVDIAGACLFVIPTWLLSRLVWTSLKHPRRGFAPMPAALS